VDQGNNVDDTDHVDDTDQFLVLAVEDRLVPIGQVQHRDPTQEYAEACMCAWVIV
jgi:hypothetical protein